MVSGQSIQGFLQSGHILDISGCISIQEEYSLSPHTQTPLKCNGDSSGHQGNIHPPLSLLLPFLCSCPALEDGSYHSHTVEQT